MFIIINCWYLVIIIYDHVLPHDINLLAQWMGYFFFFTELYSSLLLECCKIIMMMCSFSSNSAKNKWTLVKATWINSRLLLLFFLSLTILFYKMYVVQMLSFLLSSKLVNAVKTSITDWIIMFTLWNTIYKQGVMNPFFGHCF